MSDKSRIFINQIPVVTTVLDTDTLVLSGKKVITIDNLRKSLYDQADSLVFDLETSVLTFTQEGVLQSLVMSDNTSWETKATAVFSLSGANYRWPSYMVKKDDRLYVIFDGGTKANFHIEQQRGMLIFTLDELIDAEEGIVNFYLFSFLVPDGAEYDSSTYFYLQAYSLNGWSAAIMSANYNVIARLSGGIAWDQTTTTDTYCSNRPLVPAKFGFIVCPTSELGETASRFKLATSISPTLSKLSTSVKKSYLFLYEWEPKELDDALTLATRGGFDTVLWHKNMWCETTGHYDVNSTRWPGGLPALVSGVNTFKDAGFNVGFHSLFAGIAPTDSYITPIPDSRLVRDYTRTLDTNIDSDDITIITTTTPSGLPSNSSVEGETYIQIDDEIIHYSGLSLIEPYGFLQCSRGECGTTATENVSPSSIYHIKNVNSQFLIDLNTSLLNEVASNFAVIANACDIDMIYFDGNERLQGGTYAQSYYGGKLVQSFYDAQENSGILLQSSSVHHYAYQMESRHASADGISDFKGYLDTRSVKFTDTVLQLMPLDIGWYFMHSYTTATPDEYEYILGATIGYDASFSLQISHNGYITYSFVGDVFDMVKKYEDLRLSGRVDDEMKERLKCNLVDRHEYRLIGDVGSEVFQRVKYGDWNTLDTESETFDVIVTDNDTNVGIQLQVLSAVGTQTITNPIITIEEETFSWSGVLNEGEYLTMWPNELVKRNAKLIETEYSTITSPNLVLSSGTYTASFSCDGVFTPLQIRSLLQPPESWSV